MKIRKMVITDRLKIILYITAGVLLFLLLSAAGLFMMNLLADEQMDTLTKAVIIFLLVCLLPLIIFCLIITARFIKDLFGDAVKVVKGTVRSKEITYGESETVFINVNGKKYNVGMSRGRKINNGDEVVINYLPVSDRVVSVRVKASKKSGKTKKAKPAASAKSVKSGRASKKKSVKSTKKK
jgi:hypothetical protein